MYEQETSTSGMSMYEPLAPAKSEVATRVARSNRCCYVGGFVLAAALIAAGGVGVSSWVRAKPNEPQLEDYLQIVDEFLDSRPRQTFIPNNGGLMQIFGPGTAAHVSCWGGGSVGGGSCGANCELADGCPFSIVRGLCRMDVYDNALAAIYYTSRYKFIHAKAILDGFLYYMYVKKQETNDRFFASFSAWCLSRY
ncbi:hypothetical protein T492DRAFT_838964 [Pavlovales sp. CCMP2436]|nr:hypothetical protein T492DRAFT_838964 [Pavlovales sp. CCMP2436]